eukprot:Protomagalhaensia_sp_Gyna_25__2338@NODE_228_length_4268_cov_30_310002_g178_i0_p1_GENE_NODE_228_length_4268_cov_30_310002_g178_i0NODE_228_length_4268_cov_30_310002_g178_i0_p1_ORF_typecomplete_len435_score80_92Gram_pos_anchor/PF00746_21/0_32_NODE_228_length_4268_cov_30_310002_g178_i015972901
MIFVVMSERAELLPKRARKLRLAAAISFSSPRHASPVPANSPFVYCETDSFGGDETTRAATANISAFPQAQPNETQPALLPPDTKENHKGPDLLQDDSPWVAARVRFSDNIKIFEYDKPEYEDNDEDPLAGFQPNNAGLESWNLSSGGGDLSDDDCISAPAHIAFIPLIPNRRLVGGGREDIEKKQYDRLKKRPPPKSPSPLGGSEVRSELGGLRGVEIKSDDSCCGGEMSTRHGGCTGDASLRHSFRPSLIEEASSSLSVAAGDDGSASPTTGDQSSFSLLVAGGSSLILVNGDSPGNGGGTSAPAPASSSSELPADKLYVESLRFGEEWREPRTPSARSRKSSTTNSGSLGLGSLELGRPEDDDNGRSNGCWKEGCLEDNNDAPSTTNRPSPQQLRQTNNSIHIKQINCSAASIPKSGGPISCRRLQERLVV